MGRWNSLTDSVIDRSMILNVDQLRKSAKKVAAMSHAYESPEARAVLPKGWRGSRSKLGSGEARKCVPVSANVSRMRLSSLEHGACNVLPVNPKASTGAGSRAGSWERRPNTVHTIV